MVLSTPTRDRILDAAVELFGERGFSGTSVADIEAAAGLSPGAGGLFHHFKSKQAVLDAGIERHLSRLRAMRDIRRIVGDLGEVRTQLAIIARYVLAELDDEAALVRLLASEARRRPELAAVVGELTGQAGVELAGWLQEHSALTADQAARVATVALGALIGPAGGALLLGAPVDRAERDRLVATWVHLVAVLMDQPPA